MNKTNERTGALFQNHFGRIPITSDRYFAMLIRYIHLNPRKHGFVDDFREWPYSSYHTLAQTDAVSKTGIKTDGEEQNLHAWMEDDPD